MSKYDPYVSRPLCLPAVRVHHHRLGVVIREGVVENVTPQARPLGCRLKELVVPAD